MNAFSHSSHEISQSSFFLNCFFQGLMDFFRGLPSPRKGRGQTDLRLRRKMWVKRPLLLYYFLLTLLWQQRCWHLSVSSARQLFFFRFTAFSLIHSHSFIPKFPRDAIWGIVKSLRNILNLCRLWSKAFKGWWKAIGLDREGSAVQQPVPSSTHFPWTAFPFDFTLLWGFFFFFFFSASNTRSRCVPSPTEIRPNG